MTLLKKFAIRPNYFCSIVILVAALCFAESALATSKTLMINPVRVVFEGRQRSATVSVANTNPDPVSYRVSLVTMRKDAEGKLYEADKETEQEAFTKSLIRFSPRRSTIEPGTRQVIKLMVRKPKNLPPGEYQTRLSIVPLADLKDSSDSGRTDSETSKINVDLIVGITIPVIIQHGKQLSEITSTGLSLIKVPALPSGLAAQVTLSRSGQYSVFGDIIVRYIPSSGSENILIAQGKSVGVYQPDGQKSFILPIQNWNIESQRSGTLRVEFLKEQSGKKSPQITAKDFPL